MAMTRMKVRMKFEMMSDEIKAEKAENENKNEIKVDEIKADEIKADEIIANAIEADKIKTEKIKAGKIETDETRGKNEGRDWGFGWQVGLPHKLYPQCEPYELLSRGGLRRSYHQPDSEPFRKEDRKESWSRSSREWLECVMYYLPHSVKQLMYKNYGNYKKYRSHGNYREYINFKFKFRRYTDRKHICRNHRNHKNHQDAEHRR